MLSLWIGWFGRCEWRTWSSRLTRGHREPHPRRIRWSTLRRKAIRIPHRLLAVDKELAVAVDGGDWTTCTGTNLTIEPQHPAHINPFELPLVDAGLNRPAGTPLVARLLPYPENGEVLSVPRARRRPCPTDR